MLGNDPQDRWFVRVGLICACFVLGAPAIAQQTEEIVVTVRKTTENVQDVPIQISTLNQEIVQSEAVRDLGDVARLTPSLQFDQGFWPSDTRVSIRGLFARSGRPSAAVLLDGIDINSEAFESSGGSALLNQRLIDLERVEVARGPQAALFGRAAFSGAINYVTRRPPEEFEIRATGQVAQNGRRELQAGIGGPIVADKLSANLLGSYYELDGDYTNPNTGGKLGGGESAGATLGLNWTPTDNVSAYWNTSYYEDEFAPQAVAFVEANAFRVVQNIGTNGVLIPDGMPNPASSPITGGCDINRINPLNPSLEGDACLWSVTGTIRAQESDIDIAPDPRTGKDFPGTDDRVFRSYVILDIDFTESMAFRSSTSYTQSEQTINFDSTQTNLIPGPGTTFFGGFAGNYADANNRFEFQQIFQEFQLSGDSGGPINWLVGANLFLEDASDRNTSKFWYRNPTLCAFVFPNAPCTFADAQRFDKTVDRDTESYSLFGLVGWQIIDQLKLTVEGRWIRDKVTVTADNTTLGADALNPPNFMYDPVAFPGFTGSVSDNNFTPRVTLDFKPIEQLLLYGSVAKGIKPPTFNTTDLVSVQVNSVGTETLWTYELGAKSTLFDGSFLVNGALFYNDYENQQTRVQFPPRSGGGLPTSGAVNAGEVRVWGAEADLTWLPTDRWVVQASYAYTNGEFEDFNLSEAQASTGVELSRSEIARAGNLQADFTGNETPGNPDHAASLLVRYQAPLAGETEWYVQGSSNYQGERWADAANLVKLDSYTLHNGQIGLQQDDWFIAFFVDNIFDDDTVRFAQQFIDQGQGFQLNTFTFPAGYFAYLPTPRIAGVRFSVTVLGRLLTYGE